MPLISIVIPAYNEADSLPVLLDELANVAGKMTQEFGDLEFETIVVDDGSSDDTLTVLNKRINDNPPPSAKNDIHLSLITLSRNFGKEGALFAGLQNAKGDYVVTMDADMQDPPSLLPEMYRAVVEEGFDDAAAYRVTRRGESRVRSAFANLFYKLINSLSDVEIVNGARDYRLMSRKMVDAVLEVAEYNRFSKGIFNWVGFKTKWIGYENVERSAGKTKWSFLSLASYAVDGIVAFSTKPLLIASLSGFVLFAVAIIMAAVIVLKTLIWGDPVAGWPSLACIVLFVGGLQLLCLGIVSQYLARAYLETKNRPLYIVRDIRS